MTGIRTERTKFWRDAELGFDLLHATYIKHSFAPHTHEHYVIGSIEGGVETFCYRGSKHYAPRDHIILVNPGEVHTGSAAHERGWTYRTLYPSTKLLREVLEIGARDAPYFPQPVIHDPPLAAKLRQFHHASEEGMSLLGRSTALFEFLSLLIQRHADVRLPFPKVRPEHHKVDEVRDYLEAHFEHEIRLEHLANLAQLSPSYLLRTFRRETGLTPHVYQLQKRLEQAKVSLEQGEAPTQVALEVGFYDQSHLGKHFKRFVGVTPAQFARGTTLKNTNAGAISS